MKNANGKNYFYGGFSRIFGFIPIFLKNKDSVDVAYTFLNLSWKVRSSVHCDFIA